MSDTATRREHILVVDDDARIRQMLIRYFEGEGFRVSAASDGPAMRDCLAKAATDIILLDLVLPGGEDGLALARDIRSRSNIPIIMLTGRDDVIDRIVGLEVGADLQPILPGKTPERLLVDVLDPSREVDPRFQDDIRVLP